MSSNLFVGNQQRERERERERERDTDRQTDRQSERERYRERAKPVNKISKGLTSDPSRIPLFKFLTLHSRALVEP